MKQSKCRCFMTSCSAKKFQVHDFEKHYMDVFEITNHVWAEYEYDLQPLIKAFKLLDYKQETNKKRLINFKSLCGDLEKEMVDLNDFWNFPIQNQFKLFQEALGLDFSYEMLLSATEIQCSLEDFPVFNLVFPIRPSNKDVLDSILKTILQFKDMKKNKKIFF
mmetsp:Transcript_10484/g.15329  ORF Transcript_10484/g.15329 Transcript_10484/m.15329 type:complete len:163 (-) Transcript_10484:16-504(-)